MTVFIGLPLALFRITNSLPVRLIVFGDTNVRLESGFESGHLTEVDIALHDVNLFNVPKHTCIEKLTSLSLESDEAVIA